MQASWRRRGWLPAVALMVTAIAFGVVYFPRERLLLRRATFIARTDGWYEGGTFNIGIQTHWLSDHEILFSRFEGSQHLQRIEYRRDLQTGREEQLAALTHALDGLKEDRVDSETISPDGRWLVRSARWDNCLLAETRGKQQHQYTSYDSDCYRAVLWMADSRHWLENYVLNGGSHGLLLHDTQHLNMTLSLPIKGRQSLYGELEVVPSLQQAISIIRSDENGSQSNGTPAGPLRLTVYKLSLDAHTKPSAPYTIAPPPGTLYEDGEHFLDYIVSPQGDRIAWLVTTRQPDVIENWLHRFLPFVHPHWMQHTGLWVCNLDGSDMHEIGHLEEPEEKEEVDSLRSLLWLPGGQRLSFEYNNALYTVSAE